MIPTDEMVDAAAKALAEAESSHDRKVPWIVHAARTAVTAALAKAPPMTSPVSAIEAIEKAMEGVTHPDAPEWIAVAQDGDGPNGGFWTCAAATTESPRYIRADFYSALARQAEALQRENAELKLKVQSMGASHG